MSVIIRLQNLPWSANALDIRGFFRGLSIPEGGVHIVGGENGDAFIAFSTDEDARQAMMLDRGKINEVQVRLLLSSRAEMQKVIETARQHSLSMQLQMSVTAANVMKQTQHQLITEVPQPPIITTNSLQDILSNRSNNGQKIGQIGQGHSSVETTRRDSREKSSSRSRGRSHDRRRSSRSSSRERDRRRSRDRSGGRRRRSRTRSRDRDRKGYRSSRRSKSRERSRDRDRSRDRGRGRRNSRESERSSRENDRDTRFPKNKPINPSSENKSNPTPVSKQPNPINIWDVSPIQQKPAQPVAQEYSFASTLNQTQTANPISATFTSNFSSIFGNSYTTKMAPGLNNSPRDSPGLQQQQTINEKPMDIDSKSSENSSKFNHFNQANNLPFFANFNATNALNKPGEIKSTLAFQNPYAPSQATPTSPSPNKPLASFSGFFASANSIEMNPPEIPKPVLNDFPKQESPSNQDDNPPPTKTTGSYEEADGCCLRIHNMCPSTTYSDIRRFFSGLYISQNGIKMINDNSGNRSGVAYIKFVRNNSIPKAMVRNDTYLKTKKVVLTPVSEDEFDSAVDSFRPSNRPSRFQDNDGHSNQKEEPETLSKSMNGSPSQSAVSSSVLILGDLPAFAKEQDIMKMFSLYPILDLFMTRTKGGGRREYEYLSYVKFHRPEDARAAYDDKSNHIIAHRPISVKMSTEEEFEKGRCEMIESEEKARIEQEEKEKARMQEIENDRMKESVNFNYLPYSKQSSDKGNDFNSQSIDNENSTQSTGDFGNNSNSNFGTAMNNQYTSSTNSSAVPYIPSLLTLDAKVPNDPRRRVDAFPTEPVPNRGRGPSTKYILVKNLPYKALVVDIGEYFVSHNLMPERIEILRNSRNQPCGEVIIEFMSAEDAEHALNLDNTKFNGRNIRIDLISLPEIEDRLGGGNYGSRGLPNMHNNGPMSMPPHNPAFNNFDGRNNYPIMNRSGPPDDMFSRNNNGFRGNGLGGHNELRGRLMFSEENDRGMPNNNSPQLSPNGLAIPEKFQRNGCVLAMENVPYKAGIEEILDFFNGFDLKPNDIIRRFNDDGTPTGDARVSFATPADAAEALQTRRRMKIYGRTIHLNFV